MHARQNSLLYTGICRWSKRGGVPDSGGDACADDKVLRLVLLQHEPHAVHIVPRVAPVPLGIEISQQQAVLNASRHVKIQLVLDKLHQAGMLGKGLAVVGMSL